MSDKNRSGTFPQNLPQTLLTIQTKDYFFLELF